MARGVNTLFSRLRMLRCSGGSMKMIIFMPVVVGTPLLTDERSTPNLDEYVSKSLKAGATSSCRVSA